jgi:hypothetical protein
MGAVLNNVRSEPEQAPVSRPTTPDNTKKADRNWIQGLGKTAAINISDDDGDDEFGHWDLTQEEEDTMAHVAESSVLPETPRKVAKNSPFMTPSSKRQRGEESLPTPASVTDDIFGTPGTGRLNSGMWDGNEPFGLRSPSKTPTPSRFRDVIEPADGKTGQNLVDEVMQVLKDQKIDDKTKGDLRGVLSKHLLKYSGIVKGRDITRFALAAKDAKITELQQKITALEIEREMDKTVIQHFKDEKAQNINSKGRGCGVP